MSKRSCVYGNDKEGIWEEDEVIPPLPDDVWNQILLSLLPELEEIFRLATVSKALNRTIQEKTVPGITQIKSSAVYNMPESLMARMISTEKISFPQHSRIHLYGDFFKDVSRLTTLNIQSHVEIPTASIQGRIKVLETTRKYPSHYLTCFTNLESLAISHGSTDSDDDDYGTETFPLSFPKLKEKFLPLSLKKLDLYTGHSTIFNSHITHLTNLTTLCISNYYSANVGLSTALSNFTNLTKLSFSIYPTFVLKQHLVPLAQNLKSIYLLTNETMKDVDDLLLQLPNLTAISLRRYREGGVFTGYSLPQLTSLTKLRLNLCRPSNVHISCLTNLKKLTLVSNYEIEDPAIAKLTSLEYLSIAGDTKLGNNCLVNKPRLKYLTLVRNHCFEDVDREVTPLPSLVDYYHVDFTQSSSSTSSSYEEDIEGEDKDESDV